MVLIMSARSTLLVRSLEQANGNKGQVVIAADFRLVKSHCLQDASIGRAFTVVEPRQVAERSDSRACLSRLFREQEGS